MTPALLSGREVVIATDLDGTILGGSAAERAHLYRWIVRERHRVGLVFVTGRSLESVRPLLDDPDIPDPDLVIGDVGASIASGDLTPIEALEAQVRGRWPGREAVLAHLADLDDLEVQAVPQRNRVSYLARAPATVAAVRVRAAALGLDVCYSCDRYLDVLPAGVDKGRALEVVLEGFEVDRARVLVCGDTLNDLSLYGLGLAGVVVGEAEPALVEATADRPHVFHATAPGAGGIAQALARLMGEQL